MNITEAMVDKGYEEFLRSCGSERDAIRAALTAALASLSHTMGVKGLEWQEAPVPPSGETLAQSTVGLYCIPHSGDRFYLRFRDKITLGDYSTLAKAKDAAQADYEQRIRSALTPTQQPDPEQCVPYGYVQDGTANLLANHGKAYVQASYDEDAGYTVSVYAQPQAVPEITREMIERGWSAVSMGRDIDPMAFSMVRGILLAALNAEVKP